MQRCHARPFAAARAMLQMPRSPRDAGRSPERAPCQVEKPVESDSEKSPRAPRLRAPGEEGALPSRRTCHARAANDAAQAPHLHADRLARQTAAKGHVDPATNHGEGLPAPPSSIPTPSEVVPSGHRGSVTWCGEEPESPEVLARRSSAERGAQHRCREGRLADQLPPAWPRGPRGVRRSPPTPVSEAA